MTIPTYVEFCAGLGGTRAGLDAAGWKCMFSLDNDPDVVAAHRIAFGDCHLGDVRTININAIPPCDLLVAGFPCQPFSSSGLRTGFSHEKGNVFQAVSWICEKHKPKVILLENVRGLLSNAYGHTFASVLKALTDLDYIISWGVLDAVWFGVPQSRPRVFIVGALPTRGNSIGTLQGISNNPISKILGEYLKPIGQPRLVDLEFIISERRPRVGLKRPSPQTPFGVYGVAVGKCSWNWDRIVPRITENVPAIGDIVCPNFTLRDSVRSVRYWGHSGITKPYFKKAALAHCLGTNIGAGPTFGVENEKLTSRPEMEALLEHANWVRAEKQHLIFRLVPTRAALLFGPHVESLQKPLMRQSVNVTKQYVMLGNLVTPEIARRLGLNIQKYILHEGNRG